MITFSPPSDENPYGFLYVNIESINTSEYTLPFTFEVVNCIDGQVKWRTSDMNIGHWSKYVEPCNSIATIKDVNNNTVEEWVWDTNLHGDLSHNFFLDWALKNKGAKGIAVGTHDGTTGEWVEPLRSGLIEAFLVEASITQYKRLVENYKGIDKCFPIFSLITPDGGDCDFFEGPDGFTNSVVEKHALNYNSEVTKTVKKSKSLNELICEVGLSGEIKWLHLDVEGIDSDLILSLDESRVRLPEFIIYESLNLSDEKKEETYRWLEKKGYQYKESGWNTVARKVNE